MILQLNHMNGKAAAATTPNVVESLYKLVEFLWYAILEAAAA